MTDAQRDWAAELKAVIAEMREVVRLRKLFGEQEASLALWADRLSALAEAAPGLVMGELRMDGNERVVTWRPSAYELPLGTKFYASPPLAPEPIEKSIYARACENDPLVKQAEQVVGALAPERAEDTKRLDWLCLHLRGAELRRVVGELNYTGDTAEFRHAIDAAMQDDKGGKS